jgi:hypothetical protein
LHLAARGLKVTTGTFVDATIINAPSSTKNANKARDPEMHQTKKGSQWYFGMRAQFVVDSHIKLIHAVVATPVLGRLTDATPFPVETQLHGTRGVSGAPLLISRGGKWQVAAIEVAAELDNAGGAAAVPTPLQSTNSGVHCLLPARRLTVNLAAEGPGLRIPSQTQPERLRCGRGQQLLPTSGAQ